MRRVESVLETCAAEDKPDLEKLKNRLINEYDMQYPAVQNREKGRANRDVEYIKKGWRIIDNCVIIPESDAIEDALREGSNTNKLSLLLWRRAGNEAKRNSQT